MARRKEVVRPPTMREALKARQAEMRARVERIRNTYIEPILARFPGMLPTKPDSAAKYAIVSSTMWFFVGLALALLLAVKLAFPEVLTSFPWLSYGRLAAAEAAVMIWGVLFTGFIGAMFAVVPRVTKTKLWSERIGAQTVLLHDQVVLAGVVLLLLGRNQGIPGLELPWPIDILMLNTMLMVAQNVFATVARRNEPRLAVPLWYYLSALVVLPVTYAFGNLAAPWYIGVNQQIVTGFAVAGSAAGLVMLGVGTAYFVLPRATGEPIYSDRLALMGFWSLVFASPFVGQVWGIQGPGQDHLETVAVTFAVWLLVPAICVLTNFLGTARDAWDRVREEPGARFVIGGTVFLFAASLLFAAGSLRTVQNVVGYTTWQMGTQTALAGGLGMFIVGLVYYLFPRIIGRKLYSVGWAVGQFWLTVFGLTTVVVALCVAGIVQGYLQIAGVQIDKPIAIGESWFVISLAIRPLYIMRIVGGTMVVTALVIFIRNLIATYASGEDAEVEVPVPPEPERVAVTV